MKKISFNIKHQFFDLLYLIGLRDRLRCPQCRAIGTYKPHGGWMDHWKSKTPRYRRWLCKWCGYYININGVGKQAINFEKGVWDHAHYLEEPLTNEDLNFIARCGQILKDLSEIDELSKIADIIREALLIKDRTYPPPPWQG